MADQSISEKSLEETLKTKLNISHVKAQDKSDGCGQAFLVTIVSPDFEGLKTVQRNQMVYRVMSAEIAGIHAWSTICKTPNEYVNLKKKTG